MAKATLIKHGLVNHLVGNFHQLPNEVIAKQNVQFNPPKDAEFWAKIDYIPAVTKKSSLCENRKSGIFQITLFCQPDQGDYDAINLAECIAEHYGTMNEIHYNNVKIVITSSTAFQGMNTKQYGADWYAIPISINYYADI